ncbi:MAG: phage protein GemA/Gp16 family protein [Candidatus Omnitrophota bacterium]
MDKKKLALIHIIKKELNLGDAEYRRILQQAVGVQSAKDLDEVSFKKLMNYFVRSKYYQVNRFGLTMRQKMYLKYLVQELGWDDTHINNFLGKYYHKYEIDKLTKNEAIKVIESLKSISEHQNKVSA